jgi:hypothetical protein
MFELSTTLLRIIDRGKHSENNDHINFVHLRYGAVLNGKEYA